VTKLKDKQTEHHRISNHSPTDPLHSTRSCVKFLDDHWTYCFPRDQSGCHGTTAPKVPFLDVRNQTFWMNC